MATRLQKLPKILFYVAAVLYPVLIYYFLVIRKTPLRMFSLFIIAFAFFAFITRTSSKKGEAKKNSFFWTSLLLLGVGVLCLITNSVIILKFYPVLMNFLFFAAFGITCFLPPNMIFRFAVMQDKTIKGSLGEKRINAYCRTVTYAWCAFFVFNGSVAAWTIFSGSDVIWSVYNGGISYILIGIFFIGEFIIRKMVQRKIPKAVPLSALNNNSRPISSVLCYDGAYRESTYKTWNDFLEDTAKLRRHIGEIASPKWLLYCDDTWYFLLAFTALLQCKKEVMLCAGAPAHAADIDGAIPLITDVVFPNGESPLNTHYIPSLLQTETPVEQFQEINADETSIIMYTTGNGKKPAEIKYRLTELERDSQAALAQWGEEFLSRKVCSTVNHHCLYGLVYAILLPFAAGVPFRRKRIEFPEELEKLSDTEYMIITEPSFLEQAVEIEKLSNICLKSPWIFTSGGVLTPEMARKASQIFGSAPVEAYNSPEISSHAAAEITGPEGFSSLGKETVIEQTENSVSLEFSVPDSSPYFDGHFPGFPILPAVAQTELVVRFASRYLETGIALSEIRRVKFSSLIRPNAPILLKLTKNDNTISFTLTSRTGETPYSSGMVSVEKK